MSLVRTVVTGTNKCGVCASSFGFLTSKKQCRMCGIICCERTCTAKVPMIGMQGDQSICKTCLAKVQPTPAAGQQQQSQSPVLTPAQQESLALLSTLFPQLDREIQRDVFLANECNLARTITFLRGDGSANSIGGQMSMQPQPAGVGASSSPSAVVPQRKSSVGSASASSSSSSAVVVPPLHTVAPDHRLTRLQKQFFFQHGFLHLTNVIPQPLITAILTEINTSLGKGINQGDYHKPTSAGGNTKHPWYCPDVTNKACVTDAYRNTPVKSLVESLLGVGKASVPNQAQIALTFPNNHHNVNPVQGAAHWSNPVNYSKAWHIDGIHRESGGFPKNEIKNFTLLVGVYLSEALYDFCGNIAVFPGSHLELEKYFRVNDPHNLLHQEGMPNIPLQAPHQLHVRPGDVLFSHYQTAHTVAPNYSSSIRYCMYFRIIHTSRSNWAEAPEAMKNIWIEYEGLHDLQIEKEQREAAEREAARLKAEEEERVRLAKIEEEARMEAIRVVAMEEERQRQLEQQRLAQQQQIQREQAAAQQLIMEQRRIQMQATQQQQSQYQPSPYQPAGGPSMMDSRAKQEEDDHLAAIALERQLNGLPPISAHQQPQQPHPSQQHMIQQPQRGLPYAPAPYQPAPINAPYATVVPPPPQQYNPYGQPPPQQQHHQQMYPSQQLQQQQQRPASSIPNGYPAAAAGTYAQPRA